MRFAFPEFGWWMLLLPAVLILLAAVYVRAGENLTNWFRKNEYQFHFPLLKYVLRGAGLCCLGLALVGPYWGRREQKINVMGREVYFLLDVSGSMNAEDLKPSRLEKAKQELKKMVQELKGDKMGLIVFTSRAFVQSPLTQDAAVLSMFIDLVKSDQFANTGTDFRQALMMALERFEKVEKPKSKTSRAIVLISDGEDFGDAYGSLLDDMKKSGIKIYPVGIGTFEGAPVPELQFGKKIGYKKTADGNPAISKLNDESLKKLAEESGTEYFLLDLQAKDLQAVSEQVKLQSAALMDSRTEQVNNNHYQWFLLPGVLMLLATMFLLPVKTKSGN